ncbi:hypothetical protein GCM10010510_41840 [Streptomyces anandii JCM 4720]|nr:hypothetical protein GCM10010510_41840 [Streptomyces anandii JCM 4720]
MQASLKQHVYQSDPVAAAAVLVEPGTGKVVAMGQSKPYGYGKNETEINYSVGSDLGGSNFGFPTGSTFKPFVAAAALEQGKPPTQEYSSPYKMPYPSPVQACDGKTWTNQEHADVENESTSEHGPYPLKEAMAKSVNTYFVQMISDIGLCPVVNMTNNLHVVQGNGDKLPQVPAIALGSKGISPLTMATAYAAFASRGMYCTPIAIESITQKIGGQQKSLPVPKSTCSRAMSQKTADTVNTLLQGVIDSGTGQQAGLSDRDNAGKTGTTDERKNAWFVGYTPNLAGAVWVGSATQKVQMENIRIGGVFNALVYGGQVPGPIWRDAMTGALEGKPSPSFNLVNIPDGGGKDKGKGKGPGTGNGNGTTDGNNGDNGGDTIGGLIGGLTDGGTGNGGTTDGGAFPNPTFSIPGGFIRGQSGGTHGNGNGGQRG